MRELIDRLTVLSEDNGTPIKNTIINLVKQTEEESVLRKVLKTLESGNIDKRIEDTINTDADAKKFIKQITDVIVNTDGSISEKDKFLEQYPKGIVDADMLIDGKPHSFKSLTGSNFGAEILKILSGLESLTPLGVGPGEVALAVLSPKIRWVGKGTEGGDLIVDGKHVEVKGARTKGGRWINTRKANMDLPTIKKTIETASNIPVPARLGATAWVDKYRPAIPQKELPKVAKTIAENVFTAVNTSGVQRALIEGNAKTITEEWLRTGFENYKKLSGFDGILMMDIPSGMTQYFTDFDSMKGKISSEGAYLYAPENEMMPKVALRTSEGSGDIDTEPSVGQDMPEVPAYAPAQKSTPDLATAAKNVTDSPAAQPAAPAKGVGRAKRQ